jgi:hypothetical protein
MRVADRARLISIGGLLVASMLLVGCDDRKSTATPELSPTPSGQPTPGQATPAPATPGQAIPLASPGQSTPGESSPAASPRAGLAVGLASLTSYHVTYRHTVEGSLDGQPYASSEQVERRVVTQPAAEDSVVQAVEPGGATSYLHFVRIGAARYFQGAADAPCSGVASDQPAGEVGEPAALLPVPVGATKIGSDTVNGVPATHFSLDGAAIGLAAGTATGDFWLADPGGYVVKYALEIQPPSAPTGAGLEAHQGISYELSEIDHVAPITLPAGCSPVLDSIPVTADAVDVVRRSAFVSFTTPSSPATVAAFYAGALPRLGWKPDAEATGQSPEQGLDFSKGTSLLRIMMEATDGGWLVSVLVFDQGAMVPIPTAAPMASNPPASAAPGASASAEPPPTPSLDPAVLGLPKEVPLYPGASQVVQLGSMGVAFETPDSTAKVAAFYTAHLKGTRWKALSHTNVNQTAVLVWMAGSSMLTISAHVQGGATTVTISVVG